MVQFNGLETQSKFYNDRESIRTFTYSILTQDRSGILNSITIVFTRRRQNIISLNVSATEVEGVSRYTIVTKATRPNAEKLTMQLRRMVEVMAAFLYEEDEIYYQEMALFKIPTKSFMNSDKLERVVRNNGARVLAIEKDHVVIEKTGHKNEILDLYKKLEDFSPTEFIASGRIVVSKTTRTTQEFLDQVVSASKRK